MHFQPKKKKINKWEKTVKIAPFLKSYFKNNIPFFVVANLVLWDLTFTQKQGFPG